ncbi:MAG: hypothetical protein GX640_24645, partial [Fibrobacter sp.]|nr:hypothetical protein [Fibrobacter sp.]
MSRADGNIFVMRNGKGVPHFVQSDSRWGSRTLGTGSSISAQGCAISCIAMFLKFYGRDVTPGTLDEYLDTHQGYVGNSVVFATALKCGEAESLMISYGGKLTVNFDSIISQRIGNNMPTVARVDYGTDADENYNHFVVIVGITSDGDYIINDPGTRLGNGAENPNNDNIISKTTRKNGYKLVAVDIFDVTDTNTQPDVAPSDPIPVSQFIPPNSRTVTVKTFTLPVKLSSGTEISSESLNEYLNHTEKQYKGGYFPLGANTVWHGGLHIHAAQGSNVYAMADGEIVAAKLAETPEKANGYYGSHNFILVKHTITGAALNKQFANTQNKMDEGADQQRDQKNNNSFNSSENRSFYSLYMHLNMETLDLTNQKLNEVSWLQKRDNQQVPENTETYVVLPGDTIEKIARQWNTTVEEVRVNNPNLESHYGKNSTGTISWYHAGDIIRRPQSKIAETVINDEIIAALKSGEIVKINNVNVKAGDLLWTSGLYGTPPPGMIHWEVFSEENLLPSFTPVEDPD